MRADRLEQVFITQRGGRLELLLVLESEAGARERVTLVSPTPGVSSAAELAAARFVARWLWQQGCELARLVRVRRHRGGNLEDAVEVRDELLRELERLRRE